ncbi:hypothetical protein MKW98_021940 [Papaver atlanticum]|uniref:Uncharacterized protein n=1 Tax=Papaver atlanticum TaxID=357466 RepID=A0AAD4TIT9_9MAGN|nr:hypothetical protein MKW98_021940 [Papaver atlanticum]
MQKSKPKISPSLPPPPTSPLSLLLLTSFSPSSILRSGTNLVISYIKRLSYSGARCYFEYIKELRRTIDGFWLNTKVCCQDIIVAMDHLGLLLPLDRKL